MSIAITENLINMLEAAEREPIVHWSEPPLGIRKTFITANELGAAQELSALQTSLPALDELNLECLKLPFRDPRKRRLVIVLEKLILKTRNRLKQLGVKNV